MDRRCFTWGGCLRQRLNNIKLSIPTIELCHANNVTLGSYLILYRIYCVFGVPWPMISHFPSIILRICCWPLKSRKSIENVFFTQTQISGPTPSNTNQARVENGHGRVCFYQNLKTTNNFWFQSGGADKLQRRNNICTLWAKVTWEAGDKCKQMTK